MPVHVKAVSVPIMCIVALVVAALLSGCGQKGPLYREAGPDASPVVEQGKQDARRESGETPVQPSVQ